jgi:HNH endonuclease/helix-turn-helix resolvase-like protein
MNPGPNGGNGGMRHRLIELFWAKVDIRSEDECWPWTSPSTWNGGYGKFGLGGGKSDGAHRISFRLVYGAIPDEACVLHHCDNPPCCNPRHLYLGDRGDNARDMVRRGRHWRDRHPDQSRGVKNGRALLDQENVAHIRERYESGEKQGDLARQFGVARTTIGRLVRGETWT